MITNINQIEIKKCTIDEIHVRSRTDSGVDVSATKNPWQIDTYLLASFINNLEAGNVNNAGVKIVKFAIKRRKVNEIKSLTIGYADYIHGQGLEFIDYTQGNNRYIYSIVPIGDNDLEGSPNEIEVESEFTGWYIVDKETNEVLSFDKFIGSEPNVDTNFIQGRVQIDTMAQYPQIYYTPQSYHTFSLSAVFIPSEYEKSGQVYERILNKFIKQHKPFLIKGSTGEVYVCDISNPRKSNPMNTWRDRDFIQVTIDAIEIMTLEEYFQS